MADQQDVDYTVILVFPGYGDERENAESIVESALHWLNNNKDEPGFRFAYPVSAHLEIVPDTDEARARIETDESVAMLFLHDVTDDERDALLPECIARDIAVCVTVDAPRRRRRRGPWKVVFSSKPSDEPPVHRLVAATLTDPVAEDEEAGERVGEVIAVLALGVMAHHWEQNPPSYPFSE
jgi:hypothetical protein